MATAKTSALTFRIEPALKDAFHAGTDLEHRSIANMVKFLIREQCDRTGIEIESQRSSTVKGEKK